LLVLITALGYTCATALFLDVYLPLPSWFLLGLGILTMLPGIGLTIHYARQLRRLRAEIRRHQVRITAMEDALHTSPESIEENYD